MNEHESHGNVTVSAMKADRSRPTARKYITARKSPPELQAKHPWRTRPDPLKDIWPHAEGMLPDAPELEAQLLFEHLAAREPWNVDARHLRTFQRRVQPWRLLHGPDKEVFFQQDRRPGKSMQLDWTRAGELGVTIGGSPYDHWRGHVVLPYSNWQWATRCPSEPLLSLRHGWQESLPRLGQAPRQLPVDNTSAATHQIGSGSERAFNPEFVSLCEPYGLEPHTIEIGRPHQHGDGESSHGHLQRRIGQPLLWRGSGDFACEREDEVFVGRGREGANAGRAEKLAEELAVREALPPSRLSEYEEGYCPGSKYSTIRVKKMGYSVPARWIGQAVKVAVYERQWKIYSGRELLLTRARRRGDRGMALDYRHVIDHLLRQPGAFAEYRCREELFPSLVFRQAYDRRIKDHGIRLGNLEYLRVLKLAAEGKESAVELMLVEYVSPPFPARSVDQIRRVLWPAPAVEMAELQPECRSYDALLSQSQPEESDVQ